MKLFYFRFVCKFLIKLDSGVRIAAHPFAGIYLPLDLLLGAIMDHSLSIEGLVLKMFWLGERNFLIE